MPFFAACRVRGLPVAAAGGEGLGLAPAPLISSAMRAALVAGSLALAGAEASASRALGRGQAEVARRAGERLGALGPVMIKFGQVLSTRRDLLGPAAEGLRFLQDSVEEAPGAPEAAGVPAAVRERLRALGVVDLGARPVAAASLARVYRGRLACGREVAVKVLRDGARESVALDGGAIRLAARALRAVNERGARDLELTMDEFLGCMERELRYEAEQENLAVMRERAASWPWLVVPEVLPELCGPGVTVMEFVESTKVDDLAALDAMGVDRAALAHALMGWFASEVIGEEWFHADPHPGNIGVAPDGRVVLYDLGLVSRLPPGAVAGAAAGMRAIASGDARSLARVLVETGCVLLAEGRTVADIEPLVEVGLQYTASRDITAAEVREALRGPAGAGADAFTLNPEVVTLARAFASLEGVCLSLDPGFKTRDVIEGLARVGVASVLRGLALGLEAVPGRIEARRERRAALGGGSDSGRDPAPGSVGHCRR